MKNIIVLLFIGLIFGSESFVVLHGNAKALYEMNAMPDSEETVTLQFQTVFRGKKIDLNQPAQKDFPSLQMLRFYLSNFVFLKDGSTVFEEKNSQHLLDLEDEKTLVLKFNLPENLDFNSLNFDLGIDSLTNVSGAMGGDLDPTKGMFWTWQSGYVNFKLEGTFAKCPTRNHEFQFHLGGYLAPFQSVQEVRLSSPKDLSTFQKLTNLQLQLDLTPFFENVDWAKKYSIMSPCKEAVEASKILANSFSIHAE